MEMYVNVMITRGVKKHHAMRSGQQRTLSSHSKGRCSRISSGSVSAAITMNSAIPLFRALVATQIINNRKDKS